MDALVNFGIDCKFMVGQGYDGASAMSGRFHGEQQYVPEKYDLAVYVHCASHRLNLAISDAYAIPVIRNCMESLRSGYNVFNIPKRQAILTLSFEKLTPEASATRLKQLCATRWIQRHESVLVFLELQNATIDALENISSWNDKTTSSAAVQLLAVIRCTEFQVSLRVISKVFAITLPFNRMLQTENLDLAATLELTVHPNNILTDIRNNAVEEFQSIFNNEMQMCEEI
ncbi:hypothetical protein CBL_12143 [Carabus blaptoides fortunei]